MANWSKRADRDRLLSTAISKWGSDAQTLQAIEEMAELITALSHHARGRIGGSKVIEEMADVQIMLWQLELMLGPMDQHVEQKLKRLQDRIASS